jgi:hypothetical protein
MTFEHAIARQEGFGQPGTLATLNHNPGNLVAGAFCYRHGATGSNHGYAVFADDAAGWVALIALLATPFYRLKTVEQAINIYCPPPNGSPLTAGNEPDVYVKNVCRWLGVRPDTPVAGLLSWAGYSPAADAPGS